MNRSRAVLSDGRDLLYYDDAPGMDRVLRAPRPPVRQADQTGELRYDVTSDEWVVIAGHRQVRTFRPGLGDCPLCPPERSRSAEVLGEYDVAVFENRFPALRPDAAMPNDHEAHQSAIGRCEVVSFTSDHDTSFANLSRRRARTIIDAWADRTDELGNLPFVEQVLVFENRGEEIGVSLHHPHGQIYAYPFVPERFARTWQIAERYRQRYATCLYCALLDREVAQETRVVTATEHFVALVPVAPAWPFECHVYPRKHVPDLSGLSADERDDLALIYRDVLARFDSLFPPPVPYIAGWVQAPSRANRELAHLHAKVFSVRRSADRVKHPAGGELLAGVGVNEVVPEVAATLLRQARSYVREGADAS